MFNHAEGLTEVRRRVKPSSRWIKVLISMPTKLEPIRQCALKSKLFLKLCLIPKQRSKPSSPVKNNLSAVHEYLERQGRNEYINLASQIAYDGMEPTLRLCSTKTRFAG